MQTKWGQLWLRRWRWSSTNWRISGSIPGTSSPHHNVSLSRILNPKLILIAPDSFRSWNATSSLQLELAQAPHPCPKAGLASWQQDLPPSSPQCASGASCCILVHTGSHSGLFQAVDIQNLLCITLKITFLSLPYLGFTWTHSIEERWHDFSLHSETTPYFLKVPGLINVELVIHSSHPF